VNLWALMLARGHHQNSYDLPNIPLIMGAIERRLLLLLFSVTIKPSGQLPLNSETTPHMICCCRDQPRKFNTRKIKLRGDNQRISLRAQVHTPRGKCPIDHYSQRALALRIPGSRLNARNSSGARPYCSRLP